MGIITGLETQSYGKQMEKAGIEALDIFEKEYGVGPAQFGTKYLGIAEDLAQGLDPETQRKAQEDIQTTQASTLRALTQSGDPSLIAAGLPGVAQATDTAQEKLRQQDLDLERAGKGELMGTLATIEGLDEAERLRRLQAAQDLYTSGVQTKLAGTEAVVSGVAQLGGALAGAVLPGLSPQLGANIGAMFKHGGEIPAYMIEMGIQPPAPLVSLQINTSESKEEKEEKDMTETMVTPGEFDHEENPIDIVQDGKKIAEATGGELVINKPDTEKIKELMELGDPEKLMSYMENVMEKITNNDSGEAQQGAQISGPGPIFVPSKSKLFSSGGASSSNLSPEEIKELIEKYGQEYVDKLLEGQQGGGQQGVGQQEGEGGEGGTNGEEGMIIPKKETGVLSKAMNALKLPFFK